MEGKCISILVHYLSSKLVCYYSMKVGGKEKRKVQRKKSRYNGRKIQVQRYNEKSQGTTKNFQRCNENFLAFSFHFSSGTTENFPSLYS